MSSSASFGAPLAHPTPLKSCRMLCLSNECISPSPLSLKTFEHAVTVYPEGPFHPHSINLELAHPHLTLSSNLNTTPFTG
jgi:hypothetical protein